MTRIGALEAVAMSDVAGPFEPDRARLYDLADRRDQLRRFASGCDRVAASFTMGDWPRAAEYRQLAAVAIALCAETVDHDRLKALASALPPKPPWMDARMPDYNGPRLPWQDDAAVARAEVDRAALEMRAWATYDVH